MRLRQANEIGLKRMKLVRLSSWGIVLVLLAFLAVGSQPHTAKNPDRALEARPAPAKADAEPVSAEEWKKIGEWLDQRKCALRWKFVDNLPEGRTKETAKQLIAARYRQIDRLKDGPFKTALIDQVRAQDEIFGLQIKYHRAPKSGEALTAMREAVGRLIDAEIAEKNARVSRLQTEAAEWKQKKNQPNFMNNLAQRYLNRENPRGVHSPGESGSPGSDAAETESSSPE
jgi:hypothetical protein